jgi:hypothetical protein
MVERTHNPSLDAEEGKKAFGYLDKKEDCDFCKKKITNVRVIRSRGQIFNPIGVFCSPSCSKEWSKKNG